MKFSKKVQAIALKKCQYWYGRYHADLTPIEALYLFSIGGKMDMHHEYYQSKFEEHVRTGTHWIRGTMTVWFHASGELAEKLAHLNTEVNDHGRK